MNKLKNKMSENSKSIKDILESKKVDCELCIKHINTIHKLETEIKELEKQLLSTSKAEAIQINDEEMIALMQLRRLKEIAQTRELTLEESKKFEIFTKIKNSVIKKDSVDVPFKTLPSNNIKQLISIASTSVKKDESE